MERRDRGVRTGTDPEDFALWCSENGIAREDHVVLYDQRGVGSAPRGLWMFKTFGHPRVSLLSGGLPAYKALNLPLDTDPPSASLSLSDRETPDPYECALDRSVALDYTRTWDAAVNTFVDPGGWQMVDARDERFHTGRLLNPIHQPFLLSGHIPASTNLPAAKLLTPDASTFLPRAALLDAFRSHRVSPGRRVLFYSSSSVSAATAWVAALLSGGWQMGPVGAVEGKGHADGDGAGAAGRASTGTVAVYEGGWAEWAKGKNSLVKSERRFERRNRWT
ncbi:hypothetical protein HDU93_006137 [Gonapodya sp. JEL0774]|nr:hypothetical protein HDU93_006137 [Gonapodya sp. JEL0774]